MVPESKNGRYSSSLAIISTFCLMILIITPVAQGSNFPGRYADNSNHTYYLSPVTNATEKLHLRNAMNWLASNTDMTVKEESFSEYSSTTDIFMASQYRSDAPFSTYYAWVTCVKTLSGNKCDRWDLIINRKNPHANLRAVACHEIGHTVGLAHLSGSNSSYSLPNRSCMRSNPDHNYLSLHDIAHINGRY